MKRHVDQINQLNKSFLGGLLGLEFTHIEDGVSECRLDVNQRLCNPGGIVHGGVTYTLADSGMALALMSSLGEGRAIATIEIKMNYFKVVKEGSLVCKTRVIDKKRRIAYLESEVLDEDGDLVAKATGSFYITGK